MIAKRARARDRAGLATRRRRAPVARAGAALPRHPRASSPSCSSGEPFDRMPLSALIEEVVAPHRNFGIAIDVRSCPSDPAEPVGARNPAILYGLGNLLENAVDFAHERVEVTADWSATGRRRHHQRRRAGLCARRSWTGSASPMSPAGGAGAWRRRRDERPRPRLLHRQDLLERSGATLDFENRAVPGARRDRAGALGPRRFRSVPAAFAAVNMSAAAEPTAGRSLSAARDQPRVSLSMIHLRLAGARPRCRPQDSGVEPSPCAVGSGPLDARLEASMAMAEPARGDARPTARC